ncbi:hypothetical protein [Herbaspirillum sp. ST 5-3]|uniref:hypothetical protein n=2 Tax=Oxalobacteraceae TaxID=75682 RepID=UPI0010A4DFA2|nr:hypothetical protein [Herbaspirillum sp. ST 5-3]
MEMPEESSSQSGRESPSTQEKSEDVQSKQMLSEQTEQTREVQQENHQPELDALETRLEHPFARSENAPPLAQSPAPAPQEDIDRRTAVPEGREEDPARQQLEQARKLLFELQQAHRERFQHLDQEQSRLTELAALISKAIEGEDKKMGDLARPGSPELPKLKGVQPLREAEPEQMQKLEQTPQVPKNAGERRSLSDAFRLFKKLQ